MSDNVLGKINDVIKARTEFMETHYIVASIKGKPSLFLMNTGEMYNEDELKRLILEETDGRIKMKDDAKKREIVLMRKDNNLKLAMPTDIADTKLIGVPNGEYGTHENIAKLKSMAGLTDSKSSGLEQLLKASRME